MAIYPERPAPFTCAICGRARPIAWRSPQFQDRPPICINCEREFGTGTYGDANPDRRTIQQISAVTEALRIEAYRTQIGESPLYG
ncbi:MAG: hypothetical protein CMP09_15250 [Yangia sp.]|nr:hypothetical protein [Salipiger sp.]